MSSVVAQKVPLKLRVPRSIRKELNHHKKVTFFDKWDVFWLQAMRLYGFVLEAKVEKWELYFERKHSDESRKSFAERFGWSVSLLTQIKDCETESYQHGYEKDFPRCFDSIIARLNSIGLGHGVTLAEVRRSACIILLDFQSKANVYDLRNGSFTFDAKYIADWEFQLIDYEQDDSGLLMGNFDEDLSVLLAGK